MSTSSWSFRCGLLIVALILGVACCPAADAKIVLTVNPWGGMGDTDAAYQLVAEYQRLHPEIEFEAISARMDEPGSLLRLMLLPQMPDIVETHLSLMPELMQAGIPSPMPQALETKARSFFFAPTLIPLSVQSRLYGLPTEYQLHGLVFNERILADEGIAAPPTTWHELRLLATKATRRNSAGEITRVGLGFPTGSEELNHIFLSLLWSNSGEYIDASGRVCLDEPEALQTVEFLAELMRQQVASPSGWDGMATGSTFMALIPSWVRGFTNAWQTRFDEFATTLIPRGNGPFATAQYGWAFIVASTAKHQKEAWDFLNWLTMERAENGMTRTGAAMAKLGSIPTNSIDLRARNDLHTDTYWQGFTDGMAFARPEPFYPQMMDRWTELRKALLPVLRLEVPPAQGVAEAQRLITRVFGMDPTVP